MCLATSLLLITAVCNKALLMNAAAVLMPGSADARSSTSKRVCAFMCSSVMCCVVLTVLLCRLCLTWADVHHLSDALWQEGAAGNDQAARGCAALHQRHGTGVVTRCQHASLQQQHHRRQPPPKHTM